MSSNIAAIKRTRRDFNLGESFLVRYVLKGLLAIVTILVFLTLIQCSINNPQLPTWTTDFTIPAINKTYSAPEIIDKIGRSVLQIDSLGAINFALNEELDTIKNGDQSILDDLSGAFSGHLGSVNLKPANPSPVTVNLSDYAVLGLGEVPEGSFIIANEVPSLSDFNWVEIASGQIDIAVANNFGLDLDSVTVVLYDATTSEIIASDQFPPPGILSGLVDTVSLVLDGQTISNHLRAELHCHTYGGPMLSLDDKTLTTSPEFPDSLVIASAEARIPATKRNFSSSLEIAGQTLIDSARLISGNVVLTVQNSTGLGAAVNITFPDIVKAGDPLSVAQYFLPDSSGQVDVDLGGCEIIASDHIRPQEMPIEIEALLDSSGSDMAVVSDDDSIIVSARISDLTFESLTGIIDSVVIDLGQIRFGTDVPDELDSVSLAGATLVLEVESAFDFPGGLDVTIAGGPGQQLNITGDIDRGNIENPVTSYIIDSNMASIFVPLPESLTVGGSLFVGNGSGAGTITPNDYAVIRMNITAPIELTISEASFTGDTVSKHISQDDIGIVLPHLIECRYNSTITNHLPLSAAVEIYIDSSPDRLNANDAELVIGPIMIDAGQVGPGNIVIESTQSSSSVLIDSSQIRILENNNIFVAAHVRLLGTPGQPIRLTAFDFITINGVIDVQYEFTHES
jgi:hypothetical protein